MPSLLPDATVTFRDGALNQPSPSTASTQMKFGVAATGFANTIYSINDATSLTKALGNAGPLVEAGAQALAEGGGPIYFTPVLPSTFGSIVAPTKFGTGAETLTIAAKPAAQILAKITTGGAVATSQVAFSVDGGVTWSPPIATAAVVQVPNSLLTKLAFTGASAGDFVLNDIWTVTTAGAATLTGTGTGTVALSSASPVDTYNILVQIIVGGALGTMQFSYSLDGGLTTLGPILSAGSGIYVVPDAGFMFTFSGSSTAGDYFLGSCTSASYSSSDLAAAWNAVITDTRTFGLAHFVGAPSTVGNAATLLASIDTLLNTAANNFRYVAAFMEVPSDTDANTLAAFAASSSVRIAACAGYAYTTGALKPWTLPRNSAWHASSRASATTFKEALSRVATGPLRQIPGSLPSAPGIAANPKPLLRDEQVTQGLDAGRFITLRSILGKTGVFITNPNLMAPVGSDFKWLQYRRVLDVAAGNLRAIAITFLNDSVIANPDGTISETSARAIEQTCDNYVRTQLPQGSISELTITVDRTAKIVTTSTLPITLRVLPVGYANFITLDVGFKNLSLAA